MAGLDPSSLFTGGGLTALAGILAYIARLGMAWVKERRLGRRPARPVSELTDASSANKILMDTLNAVAQENVRKNKRLAEKDARITELEALVDKLRDEVEKERKHD